MTHSNNHISQAHSTHKGSHGALIASSIRAQLAQWVGALLCLGLCVSCVVKEELGGVYNQARFGLNHWSLSAGQSPDQLEFNLGYLIGLEDSEGVGEFTWRYELLTPRQEVIASHEELMREGDAMKTSVFVQGQRQRTLALPRSLTSGGRYVLWFTLFYKGERFHEQLFALESGAEGGSLNWLNEWIEEQSLAIGGNTTFSIPEGGGEAEVSSVAGAEDLPAQGGAEGD